MTDETTLLSCPFCGGEAETWDGAGPWHVVCTKCGTVGSSCLNEAEAIAAWNTRAELGSGTCEVQHVKSGAMYDVWRYTCCGYEHAESVSEEAIPQNFCPKCGAKAVMQ